MNLLRSIKSEQNLMIGPIVSILACCIGLLVYTVIVKKKFMNWVNQFDTKDRFVVTEIPDVVLQRVSSEFYQLASIESARTNVSFRDIYDMCNVCCDEKAAAVFMDCFHGGVCQKCAISIFRKTRACHLCRQAIAKVYLIENREGMYQVSKQFELS